MRWDSLNTRLLTTALRGKIPTETEDWMAKALVENIKPGLIRNPKLPMQVRPVRCEN